MTVTSLWKLSFGTGLPAGVAEGSPNETTVSITDDDKPSALTVQFGAEQRTPWLRATMRGRRT